MTAAEVQFLAAGQQPTPPADDQPKPRGRCPICLFETELRDGLIRPHKQRRVRRDTRQRAPVRGVIYKTADNCDGHGQPPLNNDQQ